MEDSLLDSPPMASLAFGPLYNNPDNNQTESSQAQLILDSLNARLHGIFHNQIRQALELDLLYAKVNETGNKLHSSISGWPPTGTEYQQLQKPLHTYGTS